MCQLACFEWKLIHYMYEQFPLFYFIFQFIICLLLKILKPNYLLHYFFKNTYCPNGLNDKMMDK